MSGKIEFANAKVSNAFRLWGWVGWRDCKEARALVAMLSQTPFGFGGGLDSLLYC